MNVKMGYADLFALLIGAYGISQPYDFCAIFFGVPLFSFLECMSKAQESDHFQIGVLHAWDVATYLQRECDFTAERTAKPQTLTPV